MLDLSFGKTQNLPGFEVRSAFQQGLEAGFQQGLEAGRAEAQAYSRYIQANAHRMREGWQPVCFDEFMESEFLVENEP